jgi:hypothetical protein
MSQLGHSRPNRAVPTMSASPPIATRQRTSRIGSFVPITEVGAIALRPLSIIQTRATIYSRMLVGDQALVAAASLSRAGVSLPT